MLDSNQRFRFTGPESYQLDQRSACESQISNLKSRISNWKFEITLSNDPGRTRTCDLLFRRQTLLFHLSYWVYSIFKCGRQDSNPRRLVSKTSA